MRARVPAGPAGARGAARLGQAAAHGRVRHAGPRLRRPRVLRLVRVGLHQRRLDAAAGGRARARRGAHEARSARRDRRRGDVREPRAARAVRRRDRRGRGGGADPRADARPRRGLRSRTTCYRRLAAERGFYIPSFYDVRYAPDGTIAAFEPQAGHGRAGGREEGGGEEHRPPRSAGDDDLHARHRVRLAVPDRGRARLREPVPLLLGGLQLPARARRFRRTASWSSRARRARTRTASAWSRSRCAITRRSSASCRA